MDASPSGFERGIVVQQRWVAFKHGGKMLEGVVYALQSRAGLLLIVLPHHVTPRQKASMAADGIVAVVNNATGFQVFLNDVDDVLAVFIVNPAPNAVQADAVAHGQIGAGIHLREAGIGQLDVAVGSVCQQLGVCDVAGVEIVADVAALLAGGVDVDADALAKAQFHVHIVFCGWQGFITCQQHGQFL